MRDEKIRQMNWLAATLHEVRNQQPGFTLFAGGGSSTIDSQPVMEVLEQRVLLSRWGGGWTQEEWESTSPERRRAEFDRIWSENVTQTLQLSTLRDLMKELTVSKGHIALATLLQKQYFPLVLTTNMDRLIEHAFQKGSPAERPYEFPTIINGYSEEFAGREKMQEGHLEPGKFRSLRQVFASAPVLLKAYGDFLNLNGAITQTERDAKVLALEALIRGLVGDLIVVGYTELDDIMMRYLPVENLRLIFIGSQEPPENSFLKRHFWRKRPIFIIDDDLDFSTTLHYIAQQIGIFNEYEDITQKKLNEEDLVQVSKTSQTTSDANEILAEFIKRQQDPMVSLVNNAVFTITVDRDRRLSYEALGGALNFASGIPKEWDIDIGRLNEIVKDMGHNIATYHRLNDRESRETWRRQAKREGEDLYKSLLNASPDLGRKLEIARRVPVGADPENLTLVFRGPRTHLGMPYELLHDGETPLVIRHPLCRNVLEISSRHTKSFNLFVRTLKKPLNVLLIASDTGNTSADQEIAELEQILTTHAKQSNLPIQVYSLPTRNAGYNSVLQTISKTGPHVVHFAGHAFFQEAQPESSGLVFWKENNLSGKKVIMTTKELYRIFSTASNQTQLIFINACIGAQVGDEHLLRNNDYLGIMDALVCAGVPYIVGFRWSVTDYGSRAFTRHFYEHLLRWPVVPERAMMYARQKIYELGNGNDETWTAPILIAQNVYS